MKRLMTGLMGMTILLFSLGSGDALAASLPIKGGVLPALNLPVPKDTDERDYLGLSGAGSFRIPQIKARMVILELFSMYCPICQKDAPGVNELYQMIQKDPGWRDKIKMIGIATGNSVYETEVFKKTYQVPFPLFPDPDFSAHKAYGEARTPSFVVVKIDEKGAHEVILSQQGGFPGAEPFLDMVLKESGLK